MSISLCCAFAQPALATAYMSNTDQGFDPDEGVFVPREQYVDQFTSFDPDDIPAEETTPWWDCEEYDATSEKLPKMFRDPADELAALIAEQKDDEATACATGGDIISTSPWRMMNPRAEWRGAIQDHTSWKATSHKNRQYARHAR